MISKKLRRELLSGLSTQPAVLLYVLIKSNAERASRLRAIAWVVKKFPDFDLSSYL